MKKYISLAIAAVTMVGCSNEILIDDAKNEVKEVGIGFSTFTDLATKAENSGATAKNGLETYHSDFKVWGSKYVGGTETPVFTAQVVTNKATNSDWEYTPIRFWDKSATEYDFYAAAPANLSWSWDNTTKKLSLTDFAVDGLNIAKPKTGNDNPNPEIDNAAKFNDKDIMISNDVNNHTAYTNDAVNLTFNHILSRLNIGVKKGTNLDGFVVKLNSIKVYNMKSNGTFTEGANLGTDVLASGTVKRWSGSTSTFTDGVGYETVTEVTSDLNYVYQGLVIPQTVAVETVALDGKAHDAVGTVGETGYVPAINAVSATSAPYLVISYEIWTKEVAETAETPAVPSAKVDGYVYNYNLANIFNGTSNDDAIAFNEGWQNTLKITINPVAILFDADVYEWDTNKNVEVEIPDSNGL